MTKPIYRTRAWKSVRLRVLDRDRRICQIRLPGCREVADAVDHIVELEDGGPYYDESNLRAACISCNTAKRNTTVAARIARNARSVRAW